MHLISDMVTIGHSGHFGSDKQCLMMSRITQKCTLRHLNTVGHELVTIGLIWKMFKIMTSSDQTMPELILAHGAHLHTILIHLPSIDHALE